MADKFALVGRIGPNGILIPEPWNPGDTLKDQDGNAIGGAGGGILGSYASEASILSGGTELFSNIWSGTYPVGTKVIDITLFWNASTVYPAIGKSTINLAGSIFPLGNELVGVNGGGVLPRWFANATLAGLSYPYLLHGPGGVVGQRNGVYLMSFDKVARTFVMRFYDYHFSGTYIASYNLVFRG
jgi:hypothetical protein